MHRSDAVRRTSDAEITRPQNEFPSDSPPLPAWHVHLELQPEELATLHRLGFTGGALAWREGMPEWKPLSAGDAPEQEGPDSGQVSLEDSLSQPIPLTRRSASRENSGSVTASERPPSPFTSGRITIPPIANAMAVPRERARPEPLLPPPPHLDPRAFSPALPATRTLKLVQPFNADASPSGTVRDPQPPPSIPPLSLDARPRPAWRGLSSRAVWWGAAALLALSASNGALVSALLWSLRHDSSRPLSGSTRPPSSASVPIAPATTACAPRTEPSEAGLAGGPVSIDQLPLASSVGSARGAGEHGSSSDSSHTRAIAANSTLGSRKGGARTLGEGSVAARPLDAAVAAAGTPGPIDRGALAQAVSRATSAASSCAESPQKGRVALIFSPSGSVQGATLEQSFGEPGINSCVLRAMGRARVRAFVGEAVTVHKTIAW